MKDISRFYAGVTVASIALTLVLAASAHAQTESLYDGTLGTTPGAQGWPLVALPAVGATETYEAGNTLTTLSTLGGDTASNNGTYAGYVRADKTLDRDGFALDFTLRVNSESHASVNRAGVSLIALNEDRLGVELGFWTDTIQVQNLIGGAFVFDATEKATVSTTSLTAYTLTFFGTSYTLSSGGTTLMSGGLRDYTAFVGPIDPYETANFLFLGDDTTSARGSLSLQSASLTTTAVAAPEPASLGLALPALLAIAGTLRRRRGL